MKTEVMLDYHGKLVRAQVISDNFYNNLDLILPKLEGQIRKYRTMFDKQQKNKAFKENVLFEPAVELKESQVVKTKRFPIYPMSVSAAAEEMELLGHSFFIFWTKDERRQGDVSEERRRTRRDRPDHRIAWSSGYRRRPCFSA